MGLPEKKYFSEVEYLEFERNSNIKHEYFHGEIFAMSGASMPHNEIASNCLFELKSKLKGKPCRPYGSDLRINIPHNTLYTYPDLSIICNKPELIDNEEDTYTNPTIIVEILSPSTRNYDLGGKFLLYKQIATLKEYILIDSESVQVIKYSRNDNNSWLVTEINSVDNILQLNSVQIELHLVDIYENVKFA